MATLSTYITEVRRLLHDANANFYTDSQLTDYINSARERVVRDTGCLRTIQIVQTPAKVPASSALNSVTPANPTAWAASTSYTTSQFIFSNAYVPFTRYKVALGVKANDTNAAFNGSLGTTVTSVTMPSTISELELRDPTGANGGQPTCHIAAIRYYKKRLPNAKLASLTV